MRIRTVGDLIAALEELPEDMPIMAQTQPSYPLRELIGGVWVDDGRDDDEEANTCDACERLALGEPFLDEKEDLWVRKCYGCDHVQECEPPKPEADKIAYIVLDGHPYEGSPYGSKRAWSVL